MRKHSLHFPTTGFPFISDFFNYSELQKVVSVLFKSMSLMCNILLVDGERKFSTLSINRRTHGYVSSYVIQPKEQNWLNIKQLDVRHDKLSGTRAVTDLHIISA